MTLILLALPLGAQEPEPAWSDFRMGQYVASLGRTPADILGLDNNGEIVLACRSGCTRSTLAQQGIPATDSQLELLVSWSVLTRKGESYEVGLPILDRSTMTALADDLEGVIAEVSEAIGPMVVELSALLEDAGRGGSAYAVLFGYLLDGEVWYYLDELGIIDQHRVRAGRMWFGHAWAYHAESRLEPRTTTFRRDMTVGRIVLVPEIAESLEPLVQGSPGLKTIFSERFDREAASDAELGEVLTRYGLLGEDRELRFATVLAERGEPIFDLCLRITQEVAETVAREIDGEGLSERLGLESASRAFVIAYHEAMWTIMERLVERGEVQVPDAFTERPGDAVLDASDLVVLVRQPQPERTDADPADEG